MKKSLILYILALVMVGSLALALTINPTTFAQVDDLTENPPLSAAGTAEDPYFTVSNVSNFTVNGSYTAGSGSATWSSNATAGPGGGNWSILKVVFYETGTFSYKSSMTMYQNGGRLSVNTKSSGVYYWMLVPGAPATEKTAGEIQSANKVDEGTGDKNHSVNITRSALIDGKATLYFAFQSQTSTSWISSKNDQIAFKSMAFTYIAPEVATLNISVTGNNGSIYAVCNDVVVKNGDVIDKGAMVTLTANVSSGNQFYYWKVDGNYYSKEYFDPQ